MNDKDRQNLEQLYEDLSKEQRLEMIKKFAFRPKDVAPPPDDEPDDGFLKKLPRELPSRSTLNAAAKPVKKVLDVAGAIREALIAKGFYGDELEQKVAERMKQMTRNRKKHRKD